MTKLAMRTVAKKYGTHAGPATYMQSHIDSIHSPHKTRNTIMKLKKHLNSILELSNSIMIAILPVHKVSKVPSWHDTIPLFTNFFCVRSSKELHSHHCKDEDDDQQDKGQIRQGSDGVGQNGQNVIERFPRFS